MTLKFTNAERTAAEFNDAILKLTGTANWASIGDGQTRSAVLAWLAEGNVPEPYTVPLALKRAAIEQARNQKLDAGVMWEGKLWHTHSDFRLELTAILAAYREGILSADALTTIRTKENTNEQLTRGQVVVLAAIVLQYVQSVYSESWAAKDALNA